MRYLLDTCTFLWFITGGSQLPATVLKRIVDPSHEVFLSVISIWEVIVKQQSGRMNLPQPAAPYLVRQRGRHGIESLSLDEASLTHLAKLPSLHKDPFDRMLVCQATEHGLTLVTPDPLITNYPVKSWWEEST